MHFKMDTVVENMKKMLTRRGYSQIRYDNIDNKPKISAVAADDDKVTVFFITCMKVSINVIKAIISESESTHIIIVNAFPITPDAKQTLTAMLSVLDGKSNDRSIFRFELFSCEEMMCDIIPIVPKHRKVDYRPAEWVKLPVILSSDVVSRYYDFKPGDIIEIEEEYGLAYRRCV